MFSSISLSHTLSHSLLQFLSTAHNGHGSSLTKFIDPELPWRLADGESGFSETSITFYPFQTRSTLTTMDRYQRVEKPRPETPIKNEIRMTRQGRIRNYIIYATALFQILDPFGDGLCLYLLDMLCIEKGIRDNCFHEVAFPCFKTSTPKSVYIEATRAAVDARFVSNDLQDTWEELDLDELSYEELLALGEVVRTESRGLSSDTIASLPSVNYKTQSTQNGNNDLCVIYRLDYEDGDTLTGKKLAVCSAATKSSVVLCLENLIGIERFKSLDCFLAGDDVKEKKPDPSIYLTAAKKLGLSAKECLVVEDSVIGLQTRNATGLVAPAIVAGLGALTHTLGTLVPVIGASGFTTTATAIGTIVGSFR